LNFPHELKSIGFLYSTITAMIIMGKILRDKNRDSNKY